MRQMRSDTPWDSDLHLARPNETNEEWLPSISDTPWDSDLSIYIYPMSNETNEEWLTLGQWPITYKLELASTYTHVQWDKWGVTHNWDSDLSHISWSLPLHIPMSNETNEEWHTLGQWPITYKLELASTYTHVQWDKWGVTHLGTVTYHI